MLDRFILPVTSETDSVGPSVAFQLSKYQSSFTNIEIFHFYFLINSSSAIDSTESIVQLIHNFLFNNCYIITNQSQSHRDKITSFLNEFGLDASVAADNQTLIFSPDNPPNKTPSVSSNPKRKGVNLVVNLEMPETLAKYLEKVAKMTMPSYTNFVISLVNDEEIERVREMQSTLPFCIHQMTSEMSTWRVVKKLKAYSEQQTQQMLFREERKVPVGSASKIPKNSTASVYKKATCDLVQNMQALSQST